MEIAFYLPLPSLAVLAWAWMATLMVLIGLHLRISFGINFEYEEYKPYTWKEAVIAVLISPILVTYIIYNRKSYLGKL
ncbi:TMhelix containing protein [Vibrio phage 1.121.O._10N.286.46.C4]|nr:TMhelix containing protein [Vibrio phage 1.121.O._10N.286.46.C4]